jgi:hypothetical protein
MLNLLLAGGLVIFMVLVLTLLKRRENRER